MTLQQLFSRDGTWTQGALARDANGEKCYPADPEAVCWCLVGAVLRIDFCGQSERLRKLESIIVCYVNDWNDAPARTIEDVRALVAKANV